MGTTVAELANLHASADTLETNFGKSRSAHASVVGPKRIGDYLTFVLLHHLAH